MRKLADLCTRLTRLHAFDEDRPIAPEMLTQELDRVCLAVWGCTIEEFDEDLVPPSALDWFRDADEDAAVDYSERRGYDLWMDGVDDYLHDFWDFIWMIMAEEHGLVTPERRAEYALKREAEDFVEGKRDGVISGR